MEDLRPFVFDATECRILGTLVEKALTTPETYPLTLNALVAGCNQKSNRDPQLALESFEVEGALTALQIKGTVKVVERLGSRTPRYAHRLADHLGLDAPDLAMLAELLVRGPQNAGELAARTRRMGVNLTREQLEARLQARAEGPTALFTLLPRAPGARFPRWRHRLAREAPADAADRGREPAPVAVASPAPPPVADAGVGAGAGASPASRGELAARLAALEARVAQLERRIAARFDPEGGAPGMAESPRAARPDSAPASESEDIRADWIELD